jgi:hypothetical protein
MAISYQFVRVDGSLNNRMDRRHAPDRQGTDWNIVHINPKMFYGLWVALWSIRGMSMKRDFLPTSSSGLSREYLLENGEFSVAPERAK